MRPPILALALALLASCTAKAPSPSASSIPPADDQLPLGTRLSLEATTRPPAAIPAEEVAAALAAAGVPVGPLHQVLARTVGARYCALGRTAAGLVVSICEFAGDDDAARGLALSHQTFDHLIPGRRLARNRGTVLTLASGPPDGARAAQAARAAAAFAAL